MVGVERDAEVSEAFGTEVSPHAFVIDEGGNFYGRRVAFDFIERLRDTVKFDSIEALIAQIDADVARTREVLGAEPG